MTEPTTYKPLVHIKDWCFILEGLVLSGYVVDHPRFEEGELIFTSEVLRRYEDAGVAETLNTVYKLVGDEAK